MSVDRGLTAGGVEVTGRLGEDNSGVGGEGTVDLFIDAFAGLAWGIFVGSLCKVSRLRGCVSTTASRGADKFGTGG